MALQSKRLKAYLAGAALMMAGSVAVAKDYTLSFNDADIQELIKFVADANNLTVVIDPRVKGKIKVLSSEPVNEKQLYDLFLSILDLHGFTAVREGNVVRVYQEKDARSSGGRVVAEGKAEYENEFVTEVIQLKNTNATKLIPVIRPLVPQENHMAAFADSNAIIVASTAANIDRIRQVIARLDNAAEQESEMLRLNHASAEEVVRILEQMEKSSGAADDKGPMSKRIQFIADKRTNTVIFTGEAAYRKKLVMLAKRLDSPMESFGNARVVYLRYAKAKDLAEVLTKVTQNMSKLENSQDKTKVARPGAANDAATIEADEATNSIIITAEADVMLSLDAIIKRLDIPRAQVLVEAIIVEVGDNDGRSLGIDWLFANQHGGFGSASLSSSGALGNVGKAFFAADDTQEKLTGLSGALSETPGATWGFGRIKEDGTSIAALLNALETQKSANILSTPSLMTMDNHEASIVVGSEVPFVTGSYASTGTTGGTTGGAIGNPFQTIERENVGITLKVTPRISEGDNVELELMQETSEITGSTSAGGNIITNQRSIETSVVTRDGEIIVLGGLMQDKVRESESKIPWLGDIPWLGRLFRFSGTDLEKTNLLVFIKPTIIRDPQRLQAVSSDKYNFIRGAQSQTRDDGVDLYPTEVSPLLPEWEEQLRSIEAIRRNSKPAPQPPVADPSLNSEG